MEGKLGMRRIAIMAVYDSEGIVYEYLEYYIQSLREVVSDLIIVIIGCMRDDSLIKLKKYTSEIYTKENKGYDAAAYKLVFENYLDMERLNQYDELIFSNDTCFGPFSPFGNIFEKMSKKNVDFWGLKYIENNYLNHLQSNFLVFDKSVFEDVRQYFITEISDDDDKKNVVIKFEMCLFNYLTKRGFKFGNFGESKNYNDYKAPDYCIIEEHYPMMKKRCFEKRFYSYENCSRALCYIQSRMNYDAEMILSFAKQKYYIDDDLLEDKISLPFFVQKSVCSQEDIEEFCKKNREIYVYGTGYIASRIYGYYREYLGNMEGFIVSNNQNVPESYLGKSIFRISEVQDKMAGIIVAVSKAVTEEVRANLIGYKNVLYLWESV